MQEVKVFIRGWIGYFRVADMKRTLLSWDEWMRRRFRMYIWKQWKKPRTKVVNLRKLGIPADKAYQWGNSRLGYWRIAGSPVLKCSITNERLAAAGYSIVNRAVRNVQKKYNSSLTNYKSMGDAFIWNDLFPDEKVSREFLDAFVPRIISIDGERFIWELQLMQNHCTVQCEREGAGADAQIRVGKIVQEPPE